MSNLIVIVILVVVMFFAIKGSLKHLKGEGGWCGGGSEVKEPDKKLNGPVIKSKTFKIDGMHCENCANRVKRAINGIDGVSAKVNLRKKEALVRYEKDVDDSEIISAIEGQGYNVMS